MPTWKKLALALAAVPVLLVLFLETVPRVVPIPGLRIVDLAPHRDALERARVGPHPYLAYAPKPSWSFDGEKHSIRHNSMGFRGPETTWEKPADTFRIACLGGSSTYGHGPSSNETTWPARLEARLSAALPGRAIEVTNGGCQGYSSFESVQNLAHRMLPLAPDAVLVYHAVNDMRCALYPNVQRDNTHWRAVWKQEVPTALDGSFTYLVFRRYLTDAVRKRGDIGNYAIVNFDELAKRDLYAWREGQVEIGLSSFHRNLETIVALSEAGGARVALGTQALRRGDLAGAPSRDDQLRCFDYMNHIVGKVARERGALLVDVQGPLEAEARRRVEAGAATDGLFTHEVHVTDEGADFIAQRFAEAILAAGWIE